MRLLLCLALVQLGLGQTINTTGTFNWETAASWNEGVLPALSTATTSLFNEVAIENGAQVFLGASLSTLSIFSPLRIGASAAANAAADVNTALLLTSRTFQTPALIWNRGHIMMNGTAQARFRVQAGLLPSQTGDATLDGSADRSVEGGTFELASTMVGTHKVSVNGGSLQFKNANLDLNSNEIVVAAGATVQFTGQCAVASAATLRGTGEVVIAAAADVAVDAALTVSATKTSVKGNLTVAVGRTVTITGNAAEFVVETGARVYRTSASATAHVAVEAGAALRFGGAASTTAKASVEGGLVEIRNKGGVLINAGVSALAKDITFQTGSNLTLNFAGAAWNTAEVQGTLNIQAGAALAINTEPTARVILVTAGTITGKFDSLYVDGQLATSAAAGRRLLAGTVVYTNNTVEYQPGEKSSATTAQFCLVFLAPLVLFW